MEDPGLGGLDAEHMVMEGPGLGVLDAAHMEQLFCALNTNGNGHFRLKVLKYGNINTYGEKKRKKVGYLMHQVLSAPKPCVPGPCLF